MLWQVDYIPNDYEDAIIKMENYVNHMIHDGYPNKIWLLEHLPVYTKGTSASDTDLIKNPNNIPIIESSRGGKHTYHGPGQRIIYPMINLNSSKDLSLYIKNLQQWILITLQSYNIDAFLKPQLIGIWVNHNGKDKKISALGIRVKKWIAYHGISVNISPNISNFDNIIPCGIQDFGITSMKELGVNISVQNFDSVLQENFYKVFKQ
jgi:lipoyl(octanoyl) transferase